jgi:predicted MPP superfamily phosphohydrolase
MLPLLLTSCGQVSKYVDHLEDYVFAMQYHDNFNILQLTDIHWNANTSTFESKNYLDKVFKETEAHIKAEQGEDAHIDLVELTGDMFMLSNAFHVESFVKYFEQKAEEYKFTYTAIWGNHDRHGIYHPDWLGQQFAKAKHCFYYEPNDDLYGRSNFIINLTTDGNKDSLTKWQIVNLDSGASFSETSISPFRDYDYIRPEQTTWWEKENEATNKKNKDISGADSNVPGIAYYHIPQDENQWLYDQIHENGATYTHKFFKLEGFADNGTEEYKSNFLDVAKAHNLKGAFMGHAHNVDWTVKWDDLIVGLGVKTGIELYYAHVDASSDDPAVKEGLASTGITENFDLIGASLVTIKDDTKFDLEHLYLNERESSDFVRWVKF